LPAIVGWTLILASLGQAALVTFENGNLGVASSDNQVITNQYQAGAGVTFYRGTGNNGATIVTGGVGAIKEIKGSGTGTTVSPGLGVVPGNPEAAYNLATSGTASGFNYNPDPLTTTGQVSDTVAATVGAMDGLDQTTRNAQLGDYFLRTAAFSRESLVVLYSAQVTSCTFEIWDIDGDPNTSGPTSTWGEQWRVRAYNGDWTTPVIETYSVYVAGAGNASAPLRGNLDTVSYDAQSYLMSLSGAEFDRFIISFEGQAGNVLKTNETVGLAFNNFNTIPEPGTFSLLAFGGTALLITRRRKVARA
jgi:hypothetical protein